MINEKQLREYLELKTQIPTEVIPALSEKFSFDYVKGFCQGRVTTAEGGLDILNSIK